MMTRPSSSPGGVSSRAAPAWGRGAEPTRWPSLASAGIASIEIATALTRVVASDLSTSPPARAALIITKPNSPPGPNYGDGAPGGRRGVGGARSHGRLDSDRRARQSEVAKPPTLETTMLVAADRTDASTAIQTDLPAIFASLELSRSTWLITSLSPGAGEKMSKHSIRAGDVAGLLMRLAQLKEKARGRTGRDFPNIAIQEAGLDGFWIHRVLQSEGIE